MKKSPPLVGKLKVVIYGREANNNVWVSVNGIMFYAPYVFDPRLDCKVGVGWIQTNDVIPINTKTLRPIGAEFRRVIYENAWQLLSPLSKVNGTIRMRFK